MLQVKVTKLWALVYIVIDYVIKENAVHLNFLSMRLR